jgi:hypothetical protein
LDLAELRRSLAGTVIEPADHEYNVREREFS